MESSTTRIGTNDVGNEMYDIPMPKPFKERNI